MQTNLKNSIPVTLIPGDGIGPEIVDSTVKVLDALGAPFSWEVHPAGMSGMDAFGDPLPQTTLDSIRRTRLALKGPFVPHPATWLRHRRWLDQVEHIAPREATQAERLYAAAIDRYFREGKL